jgi:hypothetical protein
VKFEIIGKIEKLRLLPLELTSIIWLIYKRFMADGEN